MMDKKINLLLCTLGLLVLQACTLKDVFSINSQNTQTPALAGAATSSLTQPAPSDEWFSLYFSEPQKEKTEEEPIILEGILGAIGSAKTSLEIAIYDLDLEEIGTAILEASKRGMAVRMVTDSDSLAEEETLKWLKRRGIPIVEDHSEGIMHHKFIVIDRQAVWTGSYNFTYTDTYRNNNNAVLIHSTELAEMYLLEFEEMFNKEIFGGGAARDKDLQSIKIRDSRVEACFSPEEGCAQKILSAINQAEKDIHFLAFSFTDDEIGTALVRKARMGVKISGVIESRGSENEFSELEFLQKNNLDVLADGNPYNMHHKVIVVDGKIIITGSYNFTRNANVVNDENLLIIHDQKIAARYLNEFQKIYQQADN